MGRLARHCAATPADIAIRTDQHGAGRIKIVSRHECFIVDRFCLEQKGMVIGQFAGGLGPDTAITGGQQYKAVADDIDGRNLRSGARAPGRADGT